MDVSRNVDRMLDRIERDHKVKVLYACLSGSQAWNLESCSSDFDVRFIYAHPLNWYLDIADKKRDVIDHQDGIGSTERLDAAGWDLRKALRLFAKSNTSIMEWLDSPVVYRQHGDTASALRLLQNDYIEPKSLIWNYWSIAKKHLDDYFKHDNQTSIKYYLYMIRALLCCRWIELTNGMPPTSFGTLCHKLLFDDCSPLSYKPYFNAKELYTLTDEIDKAVKFKKQHIGYMIRKEHKPFHQFIIQEFYRFEDVAKNMKVKRLDKDKSREPLNHLFRTVIAKGMMEG